MSTLRKILDLILWSGWTFLGLYFYASPPFGLGGVDLFGFDVPAWLYFLTCIFFLLRSVARLFVADNAQPDTPQGDR